MFDGRQIDDQLRTFVYKAVQGICAIGCVHLDGERSVATIEMIAYELYKYRYTNIFNSLIANQESARLLLQMAEEGWLDVWRSKTGALTPYFTPVSELDRLARHIAVEGGDETRQAPSSVR